MSALVGKDVESICGKCGDVWHVVVAKMGEKIVKVQCKQCSGYHRYRAPERGQAASPSPRSRIAGTSSSAGKSSAAKATKAPKPPPGPSVTVDPNKPSKVYKPHFTFSVGDAIDHATFGRGIVEALPNDERIQVWFSGERRVLVHGRPSQSGGAKE